MHWLAAWLSTASKMVRVATMRPFVTTREVRLSVQVATMAMVDRTPKTTPQVAPMTTRRGPGCPVATASPRSSAGKRATTTTRARATMKTKCTESGASATSGRSTSTQAGALINIDRKTKRKMDPGMKLPAIASSTIRVHEAGCPWLVAANQRNPRRGVAPGKWTMTTTTKREREGVRATRMMTGVAAGTAGVGLFPGQRESTRVARGAARGTGAGGDGGEGNNDQGIPGDAAALQSDVARPHTVTPSAPCASTKNTTTHTEGTGDGTSSRTAAREHRLAGGGGFR